MGGIEEWYKAGQAEKDAFRKSRGKKLDVSKEACRRREGKSPLAEGETLESVGRNGVGL